MIQKTAPFQADRFRSAVPYYVGGRPRYAARLIEDLGRTAGLGPASRVLDLGCGPGFLAVPLARRAGTVIGIDPDAAMLAAAQAEAAAAGVSVDWRLGSSLDLTDDLAPLDLIVMGRSFHWMDREATLRRFDELIAPNGVVATLQTDTAPAQESTWTVAFDALRKEFGQEDDYRRFRQSAEYDTHPVVLLRSAFSVVSAISVFERRVWTIEDLAMRMLSYSALAPGVLGDRRQALDRALRERLLAIRPDGLFPETVESKAILARRPG